MVTFNALTVLAIFLRCVMVKADRSSWGWIASSLCVYVLGDATWNLLAQPDGASAADALYLTYYPMMYVGIFLLVRTRSRERALAPWLDGVTAGLAIMSLVAAFFLGPIIKAATELDSLGVIVNLAYPIADLVLMAIIVACLGPLGWRPDAVLLTTGAALLLFATTDTIYLFQTAKGSYHAGSFVDLGWSSACTLLAIASWVRPKKRTAVVVDPGRVAVVPLVAVAVASAVMIAGRTRSIPAAAVVVAAAALFCAVARMVFAHRDLRVLAKTRHEARTDDLTQLLNRRAFTELLDAQTKSAHCTGLILLDLDGFKDINDSLGHRAGDDLLRIIGARLSKAVNRGYVARLGGDEFALLLPNASLAETGALATEVHRVLVEPTSVDDLEIRIDASVGIAMFPQHGRDASSLLRCVDVAMYEAKRKRTATQVYDTDTDPNGRGAMRLLAELHGAFGRDELVMHYQPKVSLIDRRVYGFEALVRWQHPTCGLLMPDDFLPVVERANLMTKLSRVALRKALADARQWPTLFGSDLSISVNIAPGDLLDENFPAAVVSALNQAGVAARRLILEITEGTLINDPQRAQRAIGRLRSFGIRVSLDDFGIGFSSLSHLASLTIDELKLDRSLVANVVSEYRSRAIVEATAGLARALGVDLVVEGIDNVATRDVLADLQCEVAQGYLFGRPMPASAIGAWFAQNSAQRDGAGSAVAPAPFVDLVATAVSSANSTMARNPV